MRITVNAEKRDVTSTHIAGLLEELGLNTSQLAVEQNGSIVPRSQHAITTLHEHDCIELVRFIGGG